MHAGNFRAMVVGAFVVSMGMTGAAMAGVVVPFTEDFTDGAANWFDGAGAAEVDWVAAGGPDGGAYVTTDAAVPDPVPEFGVLLFRAQDEFNSSNNAFVGDWVAAGVSQLSFFVRHNGPAPTTFFARIASPVNFPGAVALSFVPVLPNVWTPITIEISADNPAIVYEGPFGFNDVFGNVGHVQIGATPPDEFAGGAFTFDLDKVTIIPAPGVLAAMAFGAMMPRRRARRFE